MFAWLAQRSASMQGVKYSENKVPGIKIIDFPQIPGAVLSFVPRLFIELFVFYLPAIQISPRVPGWKQKGSSIY